jgi:CubicO group peptidase (beta-lactamase class C family)
MSSYTPSFKKIVSIFLLEIRIIEASKDRRKTGGSEMRLINRTTLVFILLVGSFLSTGGAVQIEKDTVLTEQVVERINAEISEWFKEADVPGLAAAVVDEENILWQHVEGVKVRGGDQLIDPETIFSIQSMSKSFTALGVLMAVQDGLLDLDEPIPSYLPDFTVNSIYEEHPEKKMTLRILLSHKAGFTHEAPLGNNFDCRPHEFDEHVLSIMDSWLRYPVGYRYSYSNLGIDLAGYILQKVSGKPFWDCIRDTVFRPLGMTSSSMDFAEIKRMTNRALGHVLPRQHVPDGIPVDIPLIPSGGVYTNILDMARYMRFHINKGEVDGRRILRRDLIEEMHTLQLPEHNERAGYGLGLVRAFAGPTYYLTHSGGGYGFISSMTMFPELRLGVVTLTNAHGSRVGAGRIIGIVENILGEKISVPQAVWEFDTAGYTPVPIKEKCVQRIRGIYDGRNFIGEKNGEFGLLRGKDFYPINMYFGEEGLVGVFGQNSEMRFKPELNGRPGSIVILNRATAATSVYDYHKPEKSLATPGPDRTEWASYLGVYRYLSWGRMSGSITRISVRDGYLRLGGQRCFEHLPGLFFTHNGEALDFRGTIPTFRNIMLFRRKGHWK